MLRTDTASSKLCLVPFEPVLTRAMSTGLKDYAWWSRSDVQYLACALIQGPCSRLSEHRGAAVLGGGEGCGDGVVVPFE